MQYEILIQTSKFNLRRHHRDAFRLDLKRVRVAAGQEDSGGFFPEMRCMKTESCLSVVSSDSGDREETCPRGLDDSNLRHIDLVVRKLKEFPFRFG